jgi:hypothetical protein
MWIKVLFSIFSPGKSRASASFSVSAAKARQQPGHAGRERGQNAQTAFNKISAIFVHHYR